jgi:hypothetical protein
MMSKKLQRAHQFHHLSVARKWSNIEVAISVTCCVELRTHFVLWLVAAPASSLTHFKSAEIRAGALTVTRTGQQNS